MVPWHASVIAPAGLNPVHFVIMSIAAQMGTMLATRIAKITERGVFKAAGSTCFKMRLTARGYSNGILWRPSYRIFKLQCTL